MNPLIPLETWIPLMLALSAAVILTARKTSAKLPKPWPVLSPALRLAALLCMGVLLLNPGEFRPADAEIQGNAWVLLDQSASMSVHTGDAPARFDQARDTVRSLPDAAHTRVRVLPFDRDVHPERRPEELHELTPEGDGTDLLLAVRAALDLAQGDPAPSRGILVLSDGIQTAPAAEIRELALRARAHRVPVSAVLIGEPVQRPDLDLRPHQDLLTVTAGAERAVRGVIRSRHLPDLRKPVRLLDADGNVVDETTLNLPADSDVPFTLKTGPLEAGTHAFRLEIPPEPQEARTENNQRDLRVNAVEVQLNVLLLEGVPHWDSKFLAQWFRTRQGVRLTTLHRLAEDRYFFVGPDDTAPAATGQSRLPGEQHDFRDFDLILVGRGLDYMTSPQTSAALHRFVRDGGGVLIFTRGRPVTADRPALESLIPVSWRDERSSDRLARPTRAGARSGLFGDLLPGTDSEVWEQLPALRALRQLRLTDGMAQVLLEAALPGSDEAWPVMITRRYGHGQVVLLNGDGMWHWDFQAAGDVDDRWYGDFWTQLLLWSTQAARFQPGQTWSLDWRPDPPLPGREMEFVAERRLPRDPPADRPPRLYLVPPAGDPLKIPLYPEGETGRLLARWTPPVPGVHQAGILEDDVETPSDPLRIFNIPAPPGEMDRLDPAEAPLRELVEQSGGQWLTPETAGDAFAAPEADPAAPTGEAIWHPHWSNAWFLLAMAALPGVEWGIRRRKGLI